MREFIVDAKGHLKGRLASYTAKLLLKGEHVTIVRCEEANISGNIRRNQLKFAAYLHKTMRTNPLRGHRHYRAPSQMIKKAIRGMLPHKSPRGAAAFGRLKTYDGVPTIYEKKKKLVIPDALRVQRLQARAKYTRLGDLAVAVGWGYAGIIGKLEKERLARGKAYHSKKQLDKKVKDAIWEEKQCTKNAVLTKKGKRRENAIKKLVDKLKKTKKGKKGANNKKDGKDKKEEEKEDKKTDNKEKKTDKKEKKDVKEDKKEKTDKKEKGEKNKNPFSPPDLHRPYHYKVAKKTQQAGTEYKD
ncbi:MAG: putative 60S ribosomal protein L13a [Streblomastix strix]|uniref:Putative 60S ribosomal protein L13a n=1 Tax=Streblomastix strix TaxID=222440 RepID=A0A5J4W8P7_9EUKA|nr:MAG: putative 60S ribosomal protein L13a [Streblomastix strix]